MKITNPITLDVARSNSYICLLAKQFDENSRFLIATLTNNGEPMIIPAGAAVTLRATRPDGEPVAVPGIINNDGTTTVEIDDYILEVVGSASLSIEVAIGDEILTSASFNLTIQRADGNGWLRVYVAAASLAAGNYYITIGDTPYAFTTTQAIPAGGAIYFNSDGGTAQTRDASGNVLDASLTLTAGTSGTELTSDVPTMSFLTAIAGRMVTIEAEMSQKANIDGSYPLLHAGTADNLMTGNGATQAIPFIQEGTGKGNGEATVKAGGVLQLKKKLGNTVGVNQLVFNGNFAAVQSWSKFLADYSVANNEATITQSGASDGSIFQDLSIPAGHTVLIGASIKNGTATSTSLYFRGGVAKTVTGSSYDIIRVISTAGGNNRTQIQVSGSSGTGYAKDVFVIDLTLWYGSNDRIPSDLLSHPENWGRYYAGSLAYNAGTLESADGTVMTSIGRNVWDEVSESGYINTADGANKGSSYTRSKNYIPVIPNQTYYTLLGVRTFYYDVDKNYLGFENFNSSTHQFTIPSNGAFLRFCTTGNDYTVDGNTISLYYSGESDYDQYYPYSVLAEVDTGSEALLGYDWKEPNGTIHRDTLPRIDLGTLTWVKENDHYYSNALSTILAPSSNSEVASIKSSKYVAASQTSVYGQTADKTIAISTSGRVFVYDSTITNSSQFSGIMLEAEAATPTTEQGTGFAENIPCDDFGSLSWTNTKGIPQGNEIFYPTDLKGALESIVAAIPSANGTYTLHATVTTAGVTFSWS